MKRFAIYSLIFTLGCGTCGYIGYRVGSEEARTSSRAASFIAAFDTLERLRAGDAVDGIRRLENHCFSSAVALFEASGPNAAFIEKSFTPSLTTYRHTFRTNRADWTPIEERLEVLLAKRP